ncbi:Mitochondrial distribution and morphology protein 12 [Knufia fluminis]|uniref:1-phosphatidylinositol-3-phosphate 5-kinase n=1 Tax=Knufia fluminis TaxID=191047 RepID=A0AAN8E886_9EURO|nr:Mitochondrial distribution and morphology protein 12 [Knufia fluminis]
MPSDNQSATSIPPPATRKPRRGSRASIVNDPNSSAMSQPARTGHHAASQSEDLTVFSDLTEPPASTSQPENKGLTGDIQGGLSGLYNKFKASMAATKDAEDMLKANGTDVTAPASTENTTIVTSGRTSRVHSPRVSAADSHHRLEIPLPKPSAKATKLNLPSPGLRSPHAGPSSGNLAEPTLTTFQATMNNRSHSRTGSSQDPDESLNLDQAFLSPADEHNLRKVLSRMDQDARSGRQERRLNSPPPLAKIDTRAATHSRGISEASNHDQRHTPSSRPTPQSATQDDSLTRVVSNKLDSPKVNRLPTNTLNLLDTHESDYPTSHNLARVRGAAEMALSPTTRSRNSKPRSISRVSHYKLPGFPVSRTSSTDSTRTSTTVAAARERSRLAGDGHQEGQPSTSHSRPSSRMRNRLLKKEFWMRDENARDCFRCGEPFTMVRRKHHCRTCGQIFDNKCTTLLGGSYFGVPGAIRVCKPCEVIITSQEDDSSDYSDDMTTADLSARPRTPDFSQARYDDDNISVVSHSLEHIARTPVMNLPVRRAFDKSNHSSAIFEIDAPDHGLPRPSSSRSLRTAHSMGYGHKRHHSKHTHIRSVKAYHEDRVPFQRQTVEDLRGQRNSAFHRDSVIDPELAQYLSDDASSDDEPTLHPSHSSEKLSRSGPDHDRTTISGLLAAVRKGRSRMGDRSIASFLNFNNRDADDAASIVSARAIDGPRGSRKRNLSVASSVHHKLTPRATKERLHVVLPPELDMPPSPALRGSRMIRSASMHGNSAPTLELNRASIQHVHKMLRQLLKDAEVPKVSSWENALIPILLRATDDVDPDVQGGDDIDIRSYVKLKKIPGGKPMDTSYTSGLIFTKNVALKSMQRSIPRPRILIITFPLEYARTESHFMSLDPVIRQEREYLENLVSRIAALRPDVLLAQKNISGLALELLDKVNISVVYNVKPSVLEAVSRCTHTTIYHSIDKLTSPAGELGTCGMFEVKTYLAEGRRKTYVYLSGCPPELGCTIALRGANRQTLGMIKRITDFMIYVVYNLKLETCLMRDEWALIPSSDDLARSSVGSTSSKAKQQGDTPSTNREAGGSHNSGSRELSSTTQTIGTAEAKSDVPPDVKRLDTNDSGDIPADIPVPTFYQDLADKHETRILSASPFVKFSQPYLLQRARELERRVAYLKTLRDQDLSDSVSLEEKTKAQKFTLIQPEMVHNTLEGASRKVREIVHAVHDAEYDKALYHYETQKKGWEAHLANNRNLFDPYAHQNIVVLFSTVSTHTHVPCSGPDMLAFSFYNEHEHDQDYEADCTLGQFVEDLCYRANDHCPAESCGKRMHEHQRQYVHGEAQITVFIEPFPPKLRGLQDVILMWSTCKICGTETTVAPMSSDTWKYSFGKYLELSFWSADLHARAGGCPHDLHRDHLRYFGYKGFALRVHYDAIDLLEIIVPRMRITWKVDNDLKFRNDVFTKLEHRITRFMVSVKLRLKSINVEILLPDSADACRNEVERLTKQANEDHTMLVKKLQESYTNSQHWEIIPLNLAMRALQEKVADWDEAFTEFENNFFPSEKDIRRLATLQLKKIFLDRDVSVTSLTSGEDDISIAGTDAVDEKEPSPESPGVTRKLSPEKTHNVLRSVMEENISSGGDVEDEKPPLVPSTSRPQTPPPFAQSGLSSPEDVRHASAELEHLDLALPDATPRSSAATIVPLPQTTPGSLDTSSSHPMVPQMPNDEPSVSENALPAQTNEASQGSATENTRMPLPSKTQLPTPSRSSTRRGTVSRPTSPILVRAQSQPAGTLPIRKDLGQLQRQSTMSAIHAMNGFGSGSDRKINEGQQDSSDKKFSERVLGLSSVKGHRSFIPRAIAAARKESKVSSLAKHFEQLTREFEQARLRERRQRASKTRRSQFYPAFAPKPTVEIYKNVNEAVDEVDESEESLRVPENQAVEPADTETMAQGMAETTQAARNGKGQHVEEVPGDTSTDLTENEIEIQQSCLAPSDVEERTDVEDEEDDNIVLPDSPEDLLRMSQDDDVAFKDLPKHERTSLMKMLTNFWAERSSSGWAVLEYPLLQSDHIFADCDIVVREDELSSIIAFALDSADYKTMLNDISSHVPNKSTESSQTLEAANEDEDVISHSLLRKKGSHLKYQFGDGPAKFLCKVFFAEQFDAMRRKCGVADRFIESLSRCMKFDSRGGKSKSLFLKTLDDRFVLKSLSPVETQSFLKFAPNYFQIMSEAFFHDLPSVIAKMLGFYQIIVKNPITGVEHNWFLLVMENLFYDRIPTRIFDLKGSMRNRKINATGERNEVLLDENMVDYIYESPLFSREHSKKLLRTSVHNDTLFLARQNVMDYSLMIAIDVTRKELVVGIIDCIRTYTWDKKLESWIKDRGFISAVMGASGVAQGVSGGKNRPTVTSPKEYKRRFREAMSRYVLEAPSCWHQFKPKNEREAVWKIPARNGKKGGDGSGREDVQLTAS